MGNETCLLGAVTYQNNESSNGNQNVKTHILMHMHHQIMGELKLFYNKVQRETFMRIWRAKTHLTFAECVPG